VPDVEYIERIVLPTDVAVGSNSDIEEQTDADFVVDGMHWRVIEDEPGDAHLHVDEDNMSREVLDSEVAGRLIDCIEKIDKRWRAVGANGGFYGTSRSSHFRREAEKNLRSESVKGDRKISTFYSKVSKDQNEASLSLSEEIATCSLLLKKECRKELPVHKYDIVQAVEQLKPLVMNSRSSSAQCNSSKPWEINRARAVFKYYTLLLEDIGKMAASAETALAFFPLKGHGSTAEVRTAMASKTCYKARSVREWGEEYLVTGEFPEFKQGEHAKTFCVLSNQMNKAELTSAQLVG
jgi:hypothetical protein